MQTKKIFVVWCLLLIATLVGIGFCMRWVDLPVAAYFIDNASRMGILGRGLGATVLVGAEACLIGALALARLVQGRLSYRSKALFIACCASISAFAANDYVFKKLFGRRTPLDYFLGSSNVVFHFFQGDFHSSFPSGHTVIATAFVASLVRIYPKTLPVFVVLLLIATTVLVIGDWHFVSDILAGLFVGGTAGFVAGELWLRHNQKESRDYPP